MSKIKIAITGTIGSGKSTVARRLRKLGYDVFDCDKCNKQLLNKKAYELLYEDFSECFNNKKLDKNKLTSIVFSNLERKNRLEQIMHPLIMQQLFSQDKNLIIAEVPLLFEVGWDKYFDYNILVVTDEEIALKRLQKRGFTLEQAKARIAQQMPVEEKIKKADRIIYNNGSLKSLYKQIETTILDLC